MIYIYDNVDKCCTFLSLECKFSLTLALLVQCLPKLHHSVADNFHKVCTKAVCMTAKTRGGAFDSVTVAQVTASDSTCEGTGSACSPLEDPLHGSLYEDVLICFNIYAHASSGAVTKDHNAVRNHIYAAMFLSVRAYGSCADISFPSSLSLRCSEFSVVDIISLCVSGSTTLPSCHSPVVTGAMHRPSKLARRPRGYLLSS